jgi:hypothetical protein
MEKRSKSPRILNFSIKDTSGQFHASHALPSNCVFAMQTYIAEKFQAFVWKILSLNLGAMSFILNEAFLNPSVPPETFLDNELLMYDRFIPHTF